MLPTPERGLDRESFELGKLKFPLVQVMAPALTVPSTPSRRCLQCRRLRHPHYVLGLVIALTALFVLGLLGLRMPTIGVGPLVCPLGTYSTQPSLGRLKGVGVAMCGSIAEAMALFALLVAFVILFASIVNRGMPHPFGTKST